MQPTSIFLDAADVQSLNNFIQDIPTKYGIPLLNLINQAINKNNASNEALAKSEPDTKSE